MQRGKSKCSSSKSPDRNPAMPSVSSCSLFRPSSNAQSGEVERSNPPAFRSLNGLLVAENRKPKKGFYSSCSKRREGSRTPNKNSNRYLKPGALAQLRDARINTRASSSCTAIGRKRVLVMDYGDKGNPGGGADGAAVGPLLALSKDSKNHDLSPQKKILLTPKTPSTPVTPKTNSAPPLFEEGVQDPEVESRLESLPFDLLIRILCLLHHDQLKTVFHVSQRLRKVAVVARQCYFNYTTPDRSRQEMLKMMTPRPDAHWPFVEGELSSGPLMRCPVTPKAPRHDQHRPPARLSVAEMKQISASLFQGPPSRFYRNRPPGLPRPGSRSLPSHRVLFYEDELCQAVAQNTLR